MHDSRNGGAVGRVVGLWRYPVKSTAAEALPEVDMGWHGLTGDRRWDRGIFDTFPLSVITTQTIGRLSETVGADRQGCLGVYGTTVEPGRVAVNDPVLVLAPA